MPKDPLGSACSYESDGATYLLICAAMALPVEASDCPAPVPVHLESFEHLYCERGPDASASGQ